MTTGPPKHGCRLRPMMDDLPSPPEMPPLSPGSVWLVGAGPGDPGLLSLLALHALRQADVVVYDALVDRRVLALARAVVPFRIVPGITSGVGGLAYAGIPTTHRDTNSAVAFVTGHASDGEVPDGLDWDALARMPVLVLYMALKHLDQIARRLMDGGKPGDEPVAIVVKAATPEQRVVETTLARAAADAAAERLEPPAVIAVGPVVRLRAGLDWIGAARGRRLDPDPLGRESPQQAVKGS